VAAHDGWYGVTVALTVGEMAICVAWLVLGILTTRILAVPRARLSDVRT
jgi:hypothetical protein